MTVMNTKREINDLYDYGYYIYQNPDYFKFSIDSVLLAEFVCVHKNKNKVLDLCSGNAPVPMILNIKYGDRVDITGVELQEEIYELGKDSIDYNKLDNIKLINDDVKNIPNVLKEKFDIILTSKEQRNYYEVDLHIQKIKNEFKKINYIISEDSIYEYEILTQVYCKFLFIMSIISSKKEEYIKS